MRRLILFRHAKSDWSDADRDDHERGLSTRGRRAAGPMGAWLAGRAFQVDLVICSTAKRARATWELAKAAFPEKPKVRFDNDIYMATPEALLETVRTTPAEVQTLLILGHNPGLEQFVELLASKGDSEARRTLSEKFPTAAIAVLDFAADGWADIAPHSARLDRFVTPKLLGIGEAA
jgi:phosphohistidine phosphatase